MLSNTVKVNVKQHSFQIISTYEVVTHEAERATALVLKEGRGTIMVSRTVQPTLVAAPHADTCRSRTNSKQKYA